MMKTLSLRNWLQSKETDIFVSIAEKQQNKHQFTQATSSMKQETIDLQAIHTTSKLCVIIATSIDDIKTQLKQVNDSKKSDREDMMNFKRNTLNIWINEALTSIECLKEIKNWESNVKKWKLIFQNSSIDWKSVYSLFRFIVQINGSIQAESLTQENAWNVWCSWM